MAKSKKILPIPDQPKAPIIVADCLKCINGKVGAFNLIYCNYSVTPQPNRIISKGQCIHFKC